MIVRRAERDDLPCVEEFLRNQVSLCAGWDHDKMVAWLNWFNDAVLVGGAWDGGKLIALCMGRPTDDAYKTSHDHYYLRRNGNVMWVDFFGGRLREHGMELMQLAFRHWGWEWPEGERMIAFNRMQLGRKEVKLYRIKDICRMMRTV
jgi:hypothetical protein